MINVYRTQYNGQTEFFTRKRDAIRAARAEIKRAGTVLQYVYASAFVGREPDSVELTQYRQKIAVLRSAR